MTDGMRTPEMIPDPEADAEVQARITAIQDGIRQDPVAYMILLRPLALSTGLTEDELPKDEQPTIEPDREGTHLPLRQVTTYLEQRDELYVEFDERTETALTTDPTYTHLLQQLKAGHNRVTSDTVRGRLSVYRLLFFARRVHSAAIGESSTPKA